MASVTTTSSAPSAGPPKEASIKGAEEHTILGDLNMLTKARLTFLVVVTTILGFYFGSSGSVDFLLMLHTVLGTTVVAAAAAALNQFVERDVDRRMERTADRPLAASRLPADEVVVLSASAAFFGIIYLFLMTGFWPGALAGITIFAYLYVYTPLKRITSLNTLVGAVPGAIPPVIGWSAATGTLGLGGLSVFLILFFWQMPHFLAIAWMYREDYERGGLVMISRGDESGARTSWHALGYAILLLIGSLLPWYTGLAGPYYAVAAVLLGGYFAWQALRWVREPGRPAARRLFLVSLLYLPLILAALAIDKTA